MLHLVLVGLLSQIISSEQFDNLMSMNEDFIPEVEQAILKAFEDGRVDLDEYNNILQIYKQNKPKYPDEQR